MSKTLKINTGVPQGSRLSQEIALQQTSQTSVVVKDEKVEADETAKKEANSVIDFFENNNFVNNSDKAAILYNSGGKSDSITVEGIGGETIT